MRRVASGCGLRRDGEAVRIDREDVGAVTILSFVGELVFSEPAKCFRTIVDVYGIDQVFLVFASDRAALKHFGEGVDGT